jgi:hypothetical protein
LIVFRRDRPSQSRQAIAQGRHWVDELISGDVTSTQQIASREKCTLRQVNLTISLAFLSPTLVKAAVDGDLPRGIGISTIRDLPELWAAQHLAYRPDWLAGEQDFSAAETNRQNQPYAGL